MEGSPRRPDDEPEGSPAPLSVEDHSRDAAGLEYVYPVVSRRAGGVSVGVNLNPNNACNWACVYCQVEGLVRGSAPPVDLDALERELDGFVTLASSPEWMARNVPAEARRLTDVAISGNGEPTTCAELAEVVRRIAAVKARHALELPTVLITNGSRAHLPEVQEALRVMAQGEAEVWFKLDRVTAAERRRVNQVEGGAGRVADQLAAAARCCPTRVQTCLFTIDGEPPSGEEQAAYLAFLEDQVRRGTPLRGVTLYGLARPSMQPAAGRLGKVPEDWMEDLAARLRAATGLEVSVHP